MKKYLYIIAAMATMGLTSCSDLLDRPGETVYEDQAYWTAEDNYRLYFNYYYTNYFTGYNSSFSTAYTPVRGYEFADDLVCVGKQPNFASSVPSSNGSYVFLNNWNAPYGGANWNFAWIKRTNEIIKRLVAHEADLTPEAYRHWMGIARFFRAYEYHRLVTTFGDVPWYDEPVIDTDLDNMYKDRDSRSTVVDHMYDDLKYALENVRINDGAMMVNRDVVAAVTSNIMLFQGTWQYYHKNNTLESTANLSDANANKYLQLCMEAAQMVMDGGYSCSQPFNTLFGSENLAGHPEVIFYRHYETGLTTHCIASYSNGNESNTYNANLDLLRAFICNDGKPYQVSEVENAESFSMKDLAVTRDPRFEATFIDQTWKISCSYAYQHKFISREGQSYHSNIAAAPAKYKSSVNINDYPCIRLSEVLLNWIEAKAVLAEMGNAAVTQSDIDATINQIRNRPLDAEAIARGVQLTAPLQLANIAEDPNRDSDVSPLMWEIRRERRMEFAFEGQRISDIRRWFKLDYMDNVKNPDTMLGPWVDYLNEVPEQLDNDHITTGMAVQKADGTIVKWNGSNQADMVGFAIPVNVTKRDDFNNRVYLSPIGTDITSAYQNKGYTITQTGGW